MPLISTDKEVQMHLSSMYDKLEINVKKLKEELCTHRTNYEEACNKHIKSGFQFENLWLKADQNYQVKFKEFETHCFLLEILTDYRDEQGNFIHLHEVFDTLNCLIHQFIEQEHYEMCAIIKKWQDFISYRYYLTQ
ncbi:hypothetical protein ACFRAE_07920 [Sphingobacterium sp. HJSM2_6]|uniref:hypothetical protein n=1 Tax=Sphingobacterium sp. HJSM2_6 TaxID=3366264 RepID=UPI003BE13E18